MNNTEETYCIGLLIEEMAEAQQLLGKALRFGIDAPGCDVAPYHGMSARENLPKELGDVMAAMKFAIAHGMFDEDAIMRYAQEKVDKLCNPDSEDANGNRLAPALPGDY